MVIAINKWDAVDSYQREQIQRQIETRLPFLKFASLHFISAIKRQGLGPVWQSIVQAHKSATRKMSTPVLTRLLLEAVQFQAPKRSGMFRPKMRYAHQGGMNPPIIIIHGNSQELIQRGRRVREQLRAHGSACADERLDRLLRLGGAGPVDVHPGDHPALA